MSRDVPANVRFQCDKAAMFGAAIRDAPRFKSAVLTLTFVYVSE